MLLAKWAGHASTVTTDEYYLKVSGADYNAAAKQENQKVHNSLFLGKVKKRGETTNPEESGGYEKAGDRIRTDDVQLGKLEPQNITASQTSSNDKPHGNTRNNPRNCTDFPPELQQIVTAWPTLPEHVKQAVMALVRSAKK